METKKLTPKGEVNVDGSPIPIDAFENIIRVTVREELEAADSIEVALENDHLKWTDGDLFAEGKEVSVKLGYEETSGTALVATGEIVRREAVFPMRGPAQVTIVAYDREHRLKRGRMSRVFLNQKDSDIVSSICGEAGLSADVDDTAIQHEYIFQVNQTNLSFIRERAARCGYIVDVDRENAKLAFKKPKVTEAPVVTLTWGKDLLMFRPRLSTDEQFQELEVRGWDPMAKEKITHTAKKTDVYDLMECSKQGAKIAETPFGSKMVMIVSKPIFSVDEAKQIAISYMNQHFFRFGIGQAACQGEHALKAGSVFEVAGCGKRVNGRYYVSSARHVWEPKGFTTYLEFVRPSEIAATETGTVPTAVPVTDQPPPAEPEQSYFEFRLADTKGKPYDGIEIAVETPE